MLHLEQNHRKVSTQFLESYETFPFYVSKAWYSYRINMVHYTYYH